MYPPRVSKYISRRPFLIVFIFSSEKKPFPLHLKTLIALASIVIIGIYLFGKCPFNINYLNLINVRVLLKRGVHYTVIVILYIHTHAFIICGAWCRRVTCRYDMIPIIVLYDTNIILLFFDRLIGDR